jgi:glycosyltransferase involved in cell wall biosynthesis
MIEARRPHVVMLVRNPFTHDSRVEKEAATLTGGGYRVTVVADAAPGLAREEERGAARVIRVGRRGPRIPGVSFAMHEWRLSRVLCGLRPDVLHAHDSNALVPVALAARRRGVPYVYDAHDLWLHRPRRQRSALYHGAQNAYYALVERLFVPRAAATITVSFPIARHLARSYGLDRADLVHNYPEGGDDGAELELRRLPALAAVPAGVPIILYLGGLMGGRGIEHVVRAMAEVPMAHLALLGAGHLADELAAGARAIGVADRVHVVPPVPPELVVAYARTAQIGVSPIVPSCLNYRYSLPNKLFQYMAAGLPVVASDFPQVREVVVGSGAGLVVDTAQPSAIAGALNQLLAAPATARAMGERGRRAVDERYNWSASAATLLETYRSVVSAAATTTGRR